MRLVGIAVGIVLLVTPTTYADDKAMNQLQMMQTYYNLFSTKAARTVLDSLLDGEFVAEDGPLGLRLVGKEAAWKYLTNLDTARGGREAPDRIDCHEYIGSPERGVVRWTWTFRGDVITPLFGLTPIEREVKVEGLALVTFRKGKLATLQEFYDGADMLRQLGAKIPAPQGSSPN
jgi:hypothetical protein